MIYKILLFISKLFYMFILYLCGMFNLCLGFGLSNFWIVFYSYTSLNLLLGIIVIINNRIPNYNFDLTDEIKMPTMEDIDKYFNLKKELENG